jgi:glycosyltransferase involved in cell wall biosynthesis
MRKLAQSLGIFSRVHFTGFVPDGDLPYLYSGATLYVFPSFCEGFGLPALEACSYGVPIAASNSSSLPEVLGDAAVYFDPYNVDAITERISYLLSHPEIRDQLRQRGFERVKLFSWQKMAQLTLDLYRSVV